MKLYFSPGACSLAPHIALHEAGVKFTTEQVTLSSKKMQSGGDFFKINPKGQVPTLEMENGQVLTEGAAIMQYIADQRPEKELMPKVGTTERYRAMEWLNFVATEIHKGFTPLFNPSMPEPAKEMFRGTLAKRFDLLSESLKGKKFLMGDRYTVADGYLFTTLSWAPMVGVDMSKWPVLMGHSEAVRMRPSTQAALKAEGLMK